MNIPGQDDQTVDTPSAPPAPAATGSSQELGELSAKFEVGNRGPGTVSGGQGDPGGASYGSYQMTSKPAPGTVGRFVTPPDVPFNANFNGRTPGRPQFTAAWKKLAAYDAEGFHEIQHEFIKRTHYDPLVDLIQSQDSLDISSRSFALQNVIWSTAVQHGKNTSIPHVALQRVTASQQDNDFDKQFIIAIYAERGRTKNGVLVHFTKSSAAVQQGVANRFKAEDKDALKMLADETQANSANA